MWYYFEILHLLTNQISITLFFDSTVSKKCNTNLIGQCEAPRTWLHRYGFLNSIILRVKNMAGTCEDDFFNDSILQFLREPTGSELEELMEGADAFIEEIENELQHRNKSPAPFSKQLLLMICRNSRRKTWTRIRKSHLPHHPWLFKDC